mmetsp:Transcript_59965/g.164364  ORF Transcript_59965/g.164364 Transcript_59965/m.164364 type:complete len:287 (-) Transcript_59965:201-1061(-)
MTARGRWNRTTARGTWEPGRRASATGRAPSGSAEQMASCTSSMQGSGRTNTRTAGACRLSTARSTMASGARACGTAWARATTPTAACTRASGSTISAMASAFSITPTGTTLRAAGLRTKKEGQGVHFYFNKEKRVHAKRYDGEWVDGLPKCGVYTEMPPDMQVPASFSPDPLPVAKLMDPDGVIRQRIAEIRAERARHRAKRVPLDEHFTPEELEALQVAFARVDVNNVGSISIAEIGAAFNQVGMEPTDDELAAVLDHLGKPDEGEPEFTFAEFAQSADFLSPLS